MANPTTNSMTKPVATPELVLPSDDFRDKQAPRTLTERVDLFGVSCQVTHISQRQLRCYFVKQGRFVLAENDHVVISGDYGSVRFDGLMEEMGPALHLGKFSFSLSRIGDKPWHLYIFVAQSYTNIILFDPDIIIPTSSARPIELLLTEMANWWPRMYPHMFVHKRTLVPQLIVDDGKLARKMQDAPIIAQAILPPFSLGSAYYQPGNLVHIEQHSSRATTVSAAHVVIDREKKMEVFGTTGAWHDCMDDVHHPTFMDGDRIGAYTGSYTTFQLGHWQFLSYTLGDNYFIAGRSNEIIYPLFSESKNVEHQPFITFVISRYWKLVYPATASFTGPVNYKVIAANTPELIAQVAAIDAAAKAVNKWQQ